MKLVIAEKPSVARSIYPVLGANKKCEGYMEGNGYIVSWCFGHLAHLYMPNDYGEKWSGKWTFEQLPMMPEDWNLKIKADSKEQFDILKDLINDSRVDEIICATDADREGECIFRYVYNLSGSPRKPVRRLWVSSLEEVAIKEGFANLKDGREYDNLFDAGFCRAKADWLVGMNGSRLFSVRYNTQLNVGRVQTPTLAMIVKRDYEVKNFIKQKYFTVELNCGDFTASSGKIDNENTAKSLVAAISGKTATVTEVKQELKKLKPPKLYDLTTLQREANKQFGYTAQQTLDYMQALYEGKLVTYPRTDSQYLSDDMEETAMNVIKAIFETSTFEIIVPDVIFNPNVKYCINNEKVTGHHAIIPTVNIATTDLSELPAPHKNILMLVSSRLLCATSMSHNYVTTGVKILCENTTFQANGKEITVQGWKFFEEKAKAAFKNKSTDDEGDKEIKSLPALSQGMIFHNVSAKTAEHFTNPPKAYTEDTLLSAMEHAGRDEYDDENTEKKGLGTPATRASVLEGLVNKGYVERKGKKLSATEKGINLIKAVPAEVKSPKLTAEWETKLQKVEHGNYAAETFMNEIEAFVRDICAKYSSVDNNISFGGRNTANSIGKCPKCGSDVVKGKFGWYCSSKCGMIIAKVFGKELTEAQLKKLFTGKEIPFESGGKKLIVLPKAVSNEYNDKLQWGTKKL